MNKELVLKKGFFRLARLESLKVNFRARIGAVLVKNGKPISVGKNKPTKTHPVTKKYDQFKTIHAEIDTIVGIDRHLVEDSTIYVYREKKDGSIANSKPCDMCMAFLKELGIRKIYHTNENGYDLIKL